MNKKFKVCFIVTKLLEGWQDKHIMQAIEVPRRTYFRWKAVIQTQGHSALLLEKPRGRKPELLPNQRTIDEILKLRRAYGYGPTKIEGHLRAHPIKDIVPLPHNRIYRILIEHGLNQPLGCQRRTWGKKRFVRSHAMSLLQADWKLTQKDEWMLTFLDDHSRFVLASRICADATAENAIAVLRSIGKRFGWPEQILTDRGAQFWNNRSEAPTEFSAFCAEQGVQHIVASKRRPTTIGKVEAFHGCYDAEAWRFGSHAAYIRYWNWRRPNGAIGYKYPSEVFYADRKV